MSDLDILRGLLVAAGVERVYKLGAVPAEPLYPYAVMSGVRLAPDLRTLDGSGNRPRRFLVQMFGRTHDSTADLADKSLAAFDATFLPFADSPQARAEVTSGAYRDPDDSGVMTVTHTYRF